MVCHLSITLSLSLVNTDNNIIIKNNEQSLSHLHSAQTSTIVRQVAIKHTSNELQITGWAPLVLYQQRHLYPAAKAPLAC